MLPTAESYKTFLRDRKPAEYQRLKENGELDAKAKEKVIESRELYRKYLSQLKEDNPVPEDAEYEEAVKHYEYLAMQARELVNEDIYK